MPQTILIKRGDGAPDIADLTLGELALDTVGGNIYALAGSTGNEVVTNLTAGQAIDGLGDIADVTLTTPSAGDVLVFTGTDDESENVTISGDATLAANGELTIAANAVDGGKIRLDNAQWLRGRNNADDADVNTLRVNSSDEVEVGATLRLTNGMHAGSATITNVADPVNAQDAATKKYVDDEITAIENAIAGGVIFKGTADASAATPEAATGDSDFETGWLYRVTTAGDDAFGFQANVGDYVIYNGTDWRIIDSTDPDVSGTTDRITVTGGGQAGFVVDIASTFGLSGLADVHDALNPDDGEFLVYNDAENRWEATDTIDGGSY